MKKIRLQAHRGVSTDAPENTFAAFRMSVEQGYDIIELDTKYTKDGVCVVLHDTTLNRTCRFSGGEKLSDEPPLGIGDITLEGLPNGKWKYLSREQIEYLKKS